MGLDTSHDAFSGAYSAFNAWRQCLAYAMGGSFPPHWKYTDTGQLLEENGRIVYDGQYKSDLWYWGGGYGPESHPGLHVLLMHSDSDGEIAPSGCARVADDLEALLPKIIAMNWRAVGHIARDGGYVAVTQRFIAGCRAAAAEGKPLLFR